MTTKDMETKEHVVREIARLKQPWASPDRTTFHMRMYVLMENGQTKYGIIWSKA